MRDTGKFQFFRRSEGVAYLYRAVVVQADDVARPGLLDVGPVLGHEDGGVGEGDVLADSMMPDLHTAGELAGADPQEGDPVAMSRVHVGLDLENKTGKILFVRIHIPGHGGPRTGRRGQFDEAVQQLLDTEIINGAAKKDRCLRGTQVMVVLERVGCPGDELQIIPQFIGLSAEQLVQTRIGKINRYITWL